MEFTTRSGQKVDEATLEQWAAEAERGYGPDELIPTDEFFVPEDGAVSVVVRLPTGVYRALNARASTSRATRDELIAEAVEHLLSA
jgi:predicted transcriptional regulator